MRRVLDPDCGCRHSGSGGAQRLSPGIRATNAMERLAVFLGANVGHSGRINQVPGSHPALWGAAGIMAWIQSIHDWGRQSWIRLEATYGSQARQIWKLTKDQGIQQGKRILRRRISPIYGSQVCQNGKLARIRDPTWQEESQEENIPGTHGKS